MKKSFSYEATAKKVHRKPEIGVWTDGIGFFTEESKEDRQAGFIPAYRLVPGKLYRITVEELPS